MTDKNFVDILKPMINFLENWKFEKEAEGLIPTIDLLLEELKQKQ